MRIEFHNWFRSKQGGWFTVLPEVAIYYGMTITAIQIGWFFWTLVVHLDKEMENFLTNNKDE